jgi:hypothetical protein
VNDRRDIKSVPLTRSDAWLLAALAEGSHDGRAVKLWELLSDCDYLNRAIPTFDELSFGIPGWPQRVS